jgi:large subunit ribosomal protein L21
MRQLIAAMRAAMNRHTHEEINCPIFVSLIRGKSKMYAVIKTGGKQYRVHPGDVIEVEKLPGGVGENVTFSDVLLVGDESGAKVGSPTVAGASVSGKIVEQARDRKVIVFKHKRRKGYRLKKGHRQYYTGVAIRGIEGAQADKAQGSEE